jgi:hypothetical protein
VKIASFGSLVIVAIVSVVAYDAVTAFASHALGFDYAYAIFGSLPVYIGFAVFAALRFGFGKAVAIGALIGATDASLGWWIASALGAADAPGAMGVFLWIVVFAAVVGVGTVCGLVGGAFGWWLRRRKPELQ